MNLHFDIPLIKSEITYYKAGNIQNFISTWALISPNRYNMQIIKQGLTIDFIDNIPPFTNSIKQCVFAPKEINIIDLEILKLLGKGVIHQTTRCKGDFLSSIFTRPKKDGSRGMILNLSVLNEFVVYQHFKMESLHDVQNIIKPNVWMASVDLKDAFYSIPVHVDHQKYFKFFWKGKFYEFIGMPNGYGPAMRLFTKI